MIYYSLDMNVRGYLLKRGLSIHYYAEVLYHMAQCLRIMAKETKIFPVNTVKLATNAYDAVEIPSDCVPNGIVMVGLPVGGLLKPLSKNSSLSPLRKRDTDGSFTSYNEADSETDDATGFLSQCTWFSNTNEHGEHVGRLFGVRGGTSAGYSIEYQRREIQFTGADEGTEVVVKYISDGNRADNATMVHPYATESLHDYTDWQRGPYATIHRSPDANTFYNTKRMFVVNTDDTTLEDIKNIFYNSVRAIK